MIPKSVTITKKAWQTTSRKMKRVVRGQREVAIFCKSGDKLSHFFVPVKVKGMKKLRKMM